MGFLSFIASKVAPDEVGTGGMTYVMASIGDGMVAGAGVKALASSANLHDVSSMMQGGHVVAEAATAANVAGGPAQSKGGLSA